MKYKSFFCLEIIGNKQTNKKNHFQNTLGPKIPIFNQPFF